MSLVSSEMSSDVACDVSGETAQLSGTSRCENVAIGLVCA
jgi:hypothetical protein